MKLLARVDSGLSEAASAGGRRCCQADVLARPGSVKVIEVLKASDS